MCSSAGVKRFPETDFFKKFRICVWMGWSGLFEPGRSSGVYGGRKLEWKPVVEGCAIQISAQQPRIEIDVLNLSAAVEPTILRSLSFMGTNLNSDDQHRDFFCQSTFLRGRSGLFEPGRSSGVYGGRK